jgi:hypothetical protein
MGLFKSNTTQEVDKMMNEYSGKYETTKTIYKYYMEVIGGSKELYTVKAHDMVIGGSGCYVFKLDDKVVATYPINRTIVKSIEEKQDA